MNEDAHELEQLPRKCIVCGTVGEHDALCPHRELEAEQRRLEDELLG